MRLSGLKVKGEVGGRRDVEVYSWPVLVCAQDGDGNIVPQASAFGEPPGADYMSITVVGNTTTIVYKSGGASGTVLRTLTTTVNGNTTEVEVS